MRTVESIIDAVYDRNVDAARRFNVGPSAVANWIERGNFPARLVPTIYSDAKKKRVRLKLTDIPAIDPGMAA